MLSKLLAFAAAAGLAVAGRTDKKINPANYVNLPCEDTPFCARHRAFESDMFSADVNGADLYYSVNPSSVVVNDDYGALTAQLNFACAGDSGDFASTLNLRMTFYQNGIMRTLIEEPGSTRFKISEEGLPVVEEQLIPVSDLSSRVIILSNQVIVNGLTHDDGTETFKYVLDFDHFKVSQFSNNKLTLVMNPTDSLYYEDG